MVERTSEESASLDVVDDMTKWVSGRRGALAGETESALRCLLGLGDEAALEWFPEKPTPRGIGHVVVWIEEEGTGRLGLDLQDAAPDVEGWIQRGGLSLSYRGSDGDAEPNRQGLLDRMEKALEGTSDEVFSERLGTFRGLLEKRWTYEDVGDWMYRSVYASNGHRYGLLRLGFKCNQDCYFCWQGRHWADADPAYYQVWVDELAAKGVRRLAFSGGEPTLFKELPALVDRASGHHGMETEIQTNAIQLRKRGLRRALIAAGLDVVLVSYHSHIPEISDKMTRASGTHGRTVEGIEACLGSGMRVHLNAVIDRQNAEHLPAYAQHIIDRFVRPFPDNPVGRVVLSHPNNYYDQDQWDASVVRFDRMAGKLVEACRLLAEAGVPASPFSTCGFPPCVFRDAPEFIVWQDRSQHTSIDVAGRVYADVCEKCAVRDGCLGLRKEYLAIHGDEGLVPFDRPPSAFRRHWRRWRMGLRD